MRAFMSVCPDVRDRVFEQGESGHEDAVEVDPVVGRIGIRRRGNAEGGDEGLRMRDALGFR